MVALMYHDIITPEDSSSGFQNESAFQYKVNADKFEKQVKALADRNDVVFTFDDGGESFYTLAAPILEKYGKLGWFFISTKYIGADGFLTKEQVKELEEHGHFIGSHSHSHPDNIASMPVNEMDEEWRLSCKILKGILGHDISSASIPNGYGSYTLNKSAKKAGIINLYTSEPKTNPRLSCNQTIYGRFVVHRDMSVDDVVALVTDTNRQCKMYLRWWVLNLAKKVLGSSYDRVKAMFVKK